MISCGVAKVTRKLNLTSTARHTCPPLLAPLLPTPTALRRKSDLKLSKLFHLKSSFKEYFFLHVGGRLGKVVGVRRKVEEGHAVRLISFDCFLLSMGLLCTIPQKTTEKALSVPQFYVQ